MIDTTPFVDTRRTRILVVDDDVALVTMLARRLVAHGFIVDTKVHGLGILTILAGWDNETPQPDLCILDNHMPEISGLAIVRLALRTPTARGVPIILHSADKDIQDEVEAVGHPCLVFMLKGKPSDVISVVVNFRDTGVLRLP